MNKQIEEMSKIILDEPHLDEIQGFEKRIAERLYNAGYRKQIEGEWDSLFSSMQKRIENQREEIRRLQKCNNDLTQSRNHWKAESERLGKQLHEFLERSTENTELLKGGE